MQSSCRASSVEPLHAGPVQRCSMQRHRGEQLGFADTRHRAQKAGDAFTNDRPGLLGSTAAHGGLPRGKWSSDADAGSAVYCSSASTGQLLPTSVIFSLALIGTRIFNSSSCFSSIPSKRARCHSVNHKYRFPIPVHTALHWAFAVAVVGTFIP